MGERDEIALYYEQLVRWVDLVVGCLEGLSEEEANARPIETGNSLVIIATHLIGNLSQNLAVLGGPPYPRDRDAEFRATASPGAVIARWRALRPTIEEVLFALPEGALAQTYGHPQLGDRSGRQLIVGAITHAAVHAGEAELTRDLVRARRLDTATAI